MLKTSCFSSARALTGLVVAYRELSEEEFKMWEQEFLKTQTPVSADRDELIDKAADAIEKDLILLGATAVEDKLQKGVLGCIAKLGMVGIKIWVISGDKMETAINIGYTCSLLKEYMKQIVITLDFQEISDLEKQGDKVALSKSSKASVTIDDGKSQLSSPEASSTSFGLIIDGRSLAFALNEHLEQPFLDLAVQASKASQVRFCSLMLLLVRQAD